MNASTNPVVHALEAASESLAVASPANVRTMTARFTSWCRGCNAPIARGQTIAFVRAVGTFCESCHAKGCKVCAEPRSVARWSKGAQSLTIRFSSGATMTQNARGRCIDAPCCGCCS